MWLRSECHACVANVFGSLLLDIYLVISLPAQEFVNVRQECMDPSVTTAAQASSTSAAPGVAPVNVTTTPATATRSPVSW